MAEEHDEHSEGGHGGGGGGHGGGGHGGGGGHAEGEHEGAPEWLISFADNVALMMGFFVILLAMNMGPKGGSARGSDGGANVGSESTEMLDMIISIREGFNNPVNIFSDRPEEQPLIRRIMERKGGEGSSEGVTGRYEKNQAPRPSDYDRVTAAIAFDDKSAVLPKDARDTLHQVADKQKDQRWIIEVRGHVSPFERMHNPQKGLDLSYQRAFAVAQGLIDAGMKWEQVRVVACGDGDRLVARTFDRGQDRANQRVEVVVTNYVTPDDPYSVGHAGE